MSKKLYDHIISTNYGKINDKIKAAKKKSATRKVPASNDSRAAQ